MKRVVLLAVAACLFFAFQANAQQNAQTTNKGPQANVGKGASFVAPLQKSSQQPVKKDRVGNSDLEVVPAQESKPVSNFPSDFPVYVNTGDNIKDMEVYEKAKEEWIRNNPEEYKKMQQPGYIPNK